MIDSRERFSATADLYDKHRPSYPGELLDWIVRTCHLAESAVIADVGCGTGISTRLFAERGFDVIGVDPNDAMLARATAAGGARFLRGEAAATGLPSQSVDLVTVAQAFHWFDFEPTLQEFGRILRPGGHCAVFWNVRSHEPQFMAEYDELLRAWSDEYAVIESHERCLSQLESAPRVLGPMSAVFPYAQRFDREGFAGRVFSSSYVGHGVKDRAAFEAKVGELFDRHARQGAVELRYRSVGLCFRVAQANRG